MFGELIYERIYVKLQISFIHSWETSVLENTISSHMLDKNASLFCPRNINLKTITVFLSQFSH